MVSLFVVLTQEGNLSGIVKSYVTIGFILKIDNLFSDNFPVEIKENAAKLNKSKKLVIGEDMNTFRKLFKRVKRAKEFKDYLNFFANCIINVWFFGISNFQIILYNYFAPMACVLIQVVGYASQDNSKREI